MKIILEETAEHLEGKRRVEIEWDQDDMDIYEFREKLLEPALLAWTYHPNTISELFGDDDEELGDDNAYNTMYDFDDGNGLVSAHKHKKGGGWVADTAEVDDFVYVGIDATVYGNALVFGGAKVSGEARVYDEAVVYGDARVYGNAKVYGDARVYDNDKVTGKTN